MTIHINRIEFQNFKAFQTFYIELGKMNILVGPNNCGKSTILNALRVLESGLRRANSRRPTVVPGPLGDTKGYLISTDGLPISLENVHTNYDTTIPSTVTFHMSNGNSLMLYFSSDREAVLTVLRAQKTIESPSKFRKEFPLKIGIVPVLGPVEHEEAYVSPETVNRGLVTHRASRHFRNYWHHFPDDFERFAEKIRETWPEMEIFPPENIDFEYLVMFCKEDRIDRELYWAGFGFQAWCQILTHLVRSQDATLFLIDEPDIYLHPDLQHRLISLLREIESDVLLATHSTEIISDADPSEILLIDKTKPVAQRLRDTEQIQIVIDRLGSTITLTQLARTQRILFVEGKDFRILRDFAHQIGLIELANQPNITAVSSEGFSHWERIRDFAWGLKKTPGSSLVVGVVLDRDYRCDEEIESIRQELTQRLKLTHIHSRKELENYLLDPVVLDRALKHKIVDASIRRGVLPEEIEAEPSAEILVTITESLRRGIEAQYIARRVEYLKKIGSSLDPATITQETVEIFDEKWKDINTRIEIVPGKEVFAKYNKFIQERYGISLTTKLVIQQFEEDEIPRDLYILLKRLEKFRKISL